MSEARRRLSACLTQAGVENAHLDAKWLLEHAAGDVSQDASARLSQAASAKLAEFTERRISGEPVWRIIGEREFWGLPFRLSAATLEPRPDSETVVEAVLERLAGRRHEPLTVLDLGTGTGCLLIAVLSEYSMATGLGIDLAPEACETARFNAAANGVAGRIRFQQGSWTSGLTGRFDLILSNPPYIRTGDIAGLDVAVRNHDPRLALDGGDDGLEPYRVFARTLAGHLEPYGRVVLEIGAGQEEDVVAIMREGGFVWQGSRRDLGGHPRVLIFALD